MGGEVRPKEQAHAEMAVEWVRRLRPDAGEALLLAARAHHVRRWEIARDTEPVGRAGYLRWKRKLQRHHAEVAGRVLAGVGYDEATIGRVQAIVAKERLRDDPEVQTLEDALALVFLETQLTELAGRLDDDHILDVLVRTLRKMTPAGRQAALGLPLAEGEASVVGRAVALLGAGTGVAAGSEPLD